MFRPQNLRNTRLLSRVVGLLLVVLGLQNGATANGEVPNRSKESVAEQSTNSVPLNSSVLLLDRRLLESGPAIVRRIAKLGDRRLMIVVSMHCRLNESLKPIEFGLMTDRTKSWTDLRNFEPLNEKLIEEYRQLLAATFAEAAKNEMAISIMLHLDSLSEVNEWRNFYDFDPCELIVTKKAQSYSYETAVVDSVVWAIEESVPEEMPIQFSLAGEMGRSVFGYPASYKQVVNRVRAQLAEYSLEVGLSLNHSDIAGGILASQTSHEQLDLLFSSLDFVGYSHYRPFALPIQSQQFSDVKKDFLELLSARGVTLSPNVPLHLSEVAIGGAPNKRGIAFTDWASAKPWEGTNNPRHNPWKLEPMIEFRRAYHDALLDFLGKRSETHPISAAYIWSEGSWDPMGVSSSHFVDPVIQERVIQHNSLAE